MERKKLNYSEDKKSKKKKKNEKHENDITIIIMIIWHPIDITLEKNSSYNIIRHPLPSPFSITNQTPLLTRTSSFAHFLLFNQV